MIIRMKFTTMVNDWQIVEMPFNTWSDASSWAEHYKMRMSLYGRRFLSYNMELKK